MCCCGTRCTWTTCIHTAHHHPSLMCSTQTCPATQSEWCACLLLTFIGTTAFIGLVLPSSPASTPAWRYCMTQTLASATRDMSGRWHTVEAATKPHASCLHTPPPHYLSLPICPQRGHHLRHTRTGLRTRSPLSPPLPPGTCCSSRPCGTTTC